MLQAALAERAGDEAGLRATLREAHEEAAAARAALQQQAQQQEAERRKWSLQSKTADENLGSMLNDMMAKGAPAVRVLSRELDALDSISLSIANHLRSRKAAAGAGGGVDSGRGLPISGSWDGPSAPRSCVPSIIGSSPSAPRFPPPSPRPLPSATDGARAWLRLGRQAEADAHEEMAAHMAADEAADEAADKQAAEAVAAAYEAEAAAEEQAAAAAEAAAAEAEAEKEAAAAASLAYDSEAAAEEAAAAEINSALEQNQVEFERMLAERDRMLAQRDPTLAQRDPMLTERKAWPPSTTREASSAMPSAVSSLSHTDPLEELKYPGRYPGSYPGSASRPIYATTSAAARADLAADLAADLVAANKAAVANDAVAAARAIRNEVARASKVREMPLEQDAPAEALHRYDALAEAHVQWAEREEAAAMLAALETGGARYVASPFSRSHATPSTPAYSSAFAAGGSGAAFLSRCSCRPAPSSQGTAGHPYSTMGGVAASPRVAPPPPLPGAVSSGAGSGGVSDVLARRSAYDELLQRNAAPRPATPRMTSAVSSAGPVSFTQRRDLAERHAERAHGQRATPVRPATSFGGTTMARPTLARGGIAFGA